MTKPTLLPARLCGLCGSDQLQRQSARGLAWLHCWNCDEDGPNAPADGTDLDGDGMYPPGAPVMPVRSFVFDSPLTHKYRTMRFEHVDDMRAFVDLTHAIYRHGEEPGAGKPASTEQETEDQYQAELDLCAELTMMFFLTGWEGDGEIQAFFVPPFFRAEGDGGCLIGYHVKQSNNGTSFLALPEGAVVGFYSDEDQPAWSERWAMARDRFIEKAAENLQALTKQAPPPSDAEEMVVFKVVRVLAILDHCRGEMVCSHLAVPDKRLQQWASKVRPHFRAACRQVIDPSRRDAAFWSRSLRIISGKMRGEFRRNDFSPR